jgi:hypothetical protein
VKISEASVVEVVKAASANDMDRNADANMQLANISFLISQIIAKGVPRKSLPVKKGN